MFDVEVPPGAQLMESMRAVGYSLKTAISDVIDNSISAKATRVDIHFALAPTPFVAIIDNGTGMDPDAARVAMQLAGAAATETRGIGDLGRFGLGLKTASLSQCRRLSVVTKKDDVVTAVVWDLDHIAKTNRWSLQVLDGAEIAAIPFSAEITSRKSGTLVLWENLDRLLGASGDPSKEFDEQMAETRDHLSLVFHRFLSGDGPFGRIELAINHNRIEGADPFLSKSSLTQPSQEEIISVEGHAISVKAFTLPFINKMTPAEKRRALLAGSLRDSQGFYIYRGGRLVIWGTWFRLMPKNDLGRLARVRVDIPNALDHLWSLDIKKSSANPPPVVKDRLRSLATRMLEPSQRIHAFRGRPKEVDTSLIRPWTLIEDRETFRYEINRSHPLFECFAESLDASQLRSFESTLRVLESTFPVQDMFNRMSGDQATTQLEGNADLWRQTLLTLWLQSARTHPRSQSAEQFIGRMISIEPLNQLAPERAELTQWLSSQPLTELEPN